MKVDIVVTVTRSEQAGTEYSASINSGDGVTEESAYVAAISGLKNAIRVLDGVA